MAVYEVVDVVAMGDGLMSASRAVLVTGLVSIAGVVRRAVRGVGRIDLEAVLVDMVRMRVMEVPVVKVIHVVFVTYGGVAAPVSVGVCVVLVLAAGHGFLPRG